MSGHVFVVASGFGKRVIPNTASYWFQRDSSALLVGLTGGASARIQSEQSIAAAQLAASDIADIAPGPGWPEWWLQTQPYRLPLPIGWTAEASGGLAPVAFDLLGPNESLMFVQTPRRAPPIDKMVAPGQRVVERRVLPAGESLTVQYDRDGLSYFQRHVRVVLGETLTVVTLQCQEEAFASVEATQLYLVDNLRPGEP
jgi:hypothetical protein